MEYRLVSTRLRRLATASLAAVLVATLPAAGVLLAALVAAGEAAAASPQKLTTNGIPDGCPVPPGAGSGKSTIKITGPCAFEYKGEAECNTESDDMQVITTRKGAKGAELMIYVNVERYVGAGRYKPPNDLFVGVKIDNRLYRWSTNDFEVVVAPGSKYIVLEDILLTPELPLVNCSGPQFNYQCDGRGTDAKFMATTATITGTLHCKLGGPRKARIPIP